MIRIFANDGFLDFSIRDSLPEEIAPIEMSPFDSGFLCGLMKKYRPKRILEVGVSAGGTTSIILKAIAEYELEATLTSVDLNDSWYKNADGRTMYETGYLAKRLFGEIPHWSLHTGKYLPEIIDELGGKFDFCILDTVHYTPGELLDYPVIVKFMNMGGVFVLHDVLYHQYSNPEGHSNILLYDVSVGSKIFCLNSKGHQWKQLTNIGAMIVNNDTIRYMENVFLAMTIPWKCNMNDRQLRAYHKFYLRHYGQDCAKIFLYSYEMNKRYFA